MREKKETGYLRGKMVFLFLTLSLIISIVFYLKPAIYDASAASGTEAYPPFVVRGTVTFSDGNPVIGARVYVAVGEGEGMNLSAVTDGKGRYTIAFNITPEEGVCIMAWCSHGDFVGKNSTVMEDNPLEHPIVDINIVLEKQPGMLWPGLFFCGLPIWSIIIVVVVGAMVLGYWYHRRTGGRDEFGEDNVPVEKSIGEDHSAE